MGEVGRTRTIKMFALRRGGDARGPEVEMKVGHIKIGERPEDGGMVGDK